MTYIPKNYFPHLSEPVIVYKLDESGNAGSIEYVNVRAANVLQYKHNELIGMLFSEIANVNQYSELQTLHKQLTPPPEPFKIAFYTAHQGVLNFSVVSFVQVVGTDRFIELLCLSNYSLTNSEQQSQDRFYTMAAHLHEGLVIVENNNIVYTNKAIEDITGYNASEIASLADSVGRLPAPEEKKRVQEQLALIQQKPHEKHELDFWIVTKNSERKFIHNTYSQYSTPQVNIQYVVVQDVTQKKKAETFVEQREKEFYALADNLHGVVSLFNRELICRYINPKGAELLGRLPLEYKDNSLAGFGLSDENYNKIRNGLIQVFSSHENTSLDLKLTINEKEIHLNCLFIPATFVEGEMDRAFLIGKDVSELHRLQEKLELLNMRDTLMLNDLTDTVWLLDHNFKMTYVSSSVEKLTGYSVEEYRELDSRQVYDELGADELETVLQYISQTIKTGSISQLKQSHSFETKQITKSNETVWVEVIIRPLFDENDDFIGVNGLTRNITKRKEAEFALTQAKERAIEADRLKSAFLANMSHEIRTPMNAIIGFTDLLNQEQVDAKTKAEYVELINSNSMHLLKLIDDIIDISKIEAGELNVKKVEVKIGDLFKELCAVEQEIIKKSDKTNIKLSYEAVNQNLRILADPMRLKQILTNLISNSIKFTNEGSIKFGITVQNKDFVKFYVEDTGIGMSLEKLSYIFDRFRQVEEHTSRKFQGSGLGLAISKQLVELMGGEIWVESEVGSGTRFYFTLPHNWKGNHGLNHIVEEKEESISNVLVVEDEDTNYHLLKEMLKKRNFRIFRAHDGLEAVEIANEEHLDLILMDIQLPKIDGYEATRRIRTVFPDLPIIAQTAYANYNDVVKSLDAGCSDFIAKPIKMKKLLTMIDKYIENSN
ncbi:MAG: PAS domain S-box protein [Salinivirgaceae bacterium]|jgi:PAS domain S-box-containing protein|nr:PAS domain S-box protein [Salinivirgaceae bacterium]